jgi:hypothetical protein
VSLANIRDETNEEQQREPIEHYDGSAARIEQRAAGWDTFSADVGATVAG